MPDGVDAVEWGYERVKRDLSETLERMGVHFDTWFSERSLVDRGAVEATLQELRDKDMAYDADGATWIRTEQFGDRKDQVIVRSNGEPAYLLPDLAYHRDKYGRGFQSPHRRVGRRPPRLRPEHEGRLAGARPRPRRARDRSSASS